MNKLLTVLLSFVILFAVSSCDRRSRAISPTNDTSVITPTASVDFTSHMSGIRNWAGTRYTWYASGPDTTINISETLALGILGDSTILIKGDTLHMSIADSTNGTIDFNVNINDPNGQYRVVGVYYYYASDSIVYSRNITVGHGYQEITSLHTQ